MVGSTQSDGTAFEVCLRVSSVLLQQVNLVIFPNLDVFVSVYWGYTSGYNVFNT